MHAHYMYGLVYEILRFAIWGLITAFHCYFQEGSVHYVFVGLEFETNKELRLLSIVKLFVCRPVAHITKGLWVCVQYK